MLEYDDTYVYDIMNCKNYHKVEAQLAVDKINYLQCWEIIGRLEEFQATCMADVGYDAEYAGKMIAMYKAVAVNILRYLQRF